MDKKTDVIYCMNKYCHLYETCHRRMPKEWDLTYSLGYFRPNKSTREGKCEYYEKEERDDEI